MLFNFFTFISFYSNIRISSVFDWRLSCSMAGAVIGKTNEVVNWLIDISILFQKCSTLLHNISYVLCHIFLHNCSSFFHNIFNIFHDIPYISLLFFSQISTLCCHFRHYSTILLLHLRGPPYYSCTHSSHSLKPLLYSTVFPLDLFRLPLRLLFVIFPSYFWIQSYFYYILHNFHNISTLFPHLSMTYWPHSFFRSEHSIMFLPYCNIILLPSSPIFLLHLRGPFIFHHTLVRYYHQNFRNITSDVHNISSFFPPYFLFSAFLYHFFHTISI